MGLATGFLFLSFVSIKETKLPYLYCNAHNDIFFLLKEAQLLWLSRIFIFFYTLSWTAVEISKGGVGSPRLYSTIRAIDGDRAEIERHYALNDNGIVVKVFQAHMFMSSVAGFTWQGLIKLERKRLLQASESTAIIGLTKVESSSASAQGKFWW